MRPWEPVRFTFWPLGVLVYGVPFAFVAYGAVKNYVGWPRAQGILAAAWVLFGLYQAMGFAGTHQMVQWTIIALAPPGIYAVIAALVWTVQVSWPRSDQIKDGPKSAAEE